jgi:RNA polymerase sigma factor (sigma-70 family)
MDDSDESLVTAAQGGDLAAWQALCNRHAPRLAAYLGCRLRRPAVVERLVAEVVAGAWKHLPELANPREFPAWLRKAAGNFALQWGRRHPDQVAAAPFPAERCGNDLALQERMQRLEQALGQLPDGQRMVLEQHFRGGADLPTLCESLHLGREAVEKLLDEALMALDLALGGQGP